MISEAIHPFNDYVIKTLSTPAKVVDIGAGIRPSVLWKSADHICVEPHDTYANMLIESGYTVVCETAIDYLRATKSEDTVLMLDCIEHMGKEEGEECRRLIEEKTKQAVIYTPLGFMEQHGDAWGLDGEYWQEHRSGWELEDFDNWICNVTNGAKSSKFITAVWMQ